MPVDSVALYRKPEQWYCKKRMGLRLSANTRNLRLFLQISHLYKFLVFIPINALMKKKVLQWEEKKKKFLVEVSQSNRMVGVGRYLCGSSSPTPLLKQGHLGQDAQDFVQAGLEYLQRRRICSLPGQPFPGLRHPQREEVLPHVQLELSMLQFVPIAPWCVWVLTGY